MKLFRQKNIWIGLAILFMWLGCENQQDTFEEFIDRDGEKSQVGKPQVKAVPSGENKVKFMVTVNADPRIDSGKVMNVTDEVIHQFAVNRETLTDNTVDFELTLEGNQEGNQIYKVILIDKKGKKSLTEEVSVRVLGRRYLNGLKTRSVEVGTGGKGVIFDWGDTLATSSASFIAYTNTADQATTVEVPKKVEREREEVSNNQTILTDVKLGSTLEVYTTYKPSEEAGVFRSQAKEYPVNAPVITSISPTEAEEGSGEDVTIAGRNFHATAAENTVLFGTVEAEVTQATATNLVVALPDLAPAGQHAVTIKVGETRIPGETFTVRAAKAKLLDRTKMKGLRLTGDTGDAWGWVLSNVIDGKNSTGFHNPSGITSVIVPPYTEAFSMFTIDMGVVAKLDKITWWQRLDRPYREGNVQVFELWGVDVLPADNGASMATGWTRLIAGAETTGSSKADADKGHEYAIDATHPAVRYIRFVCQKNYFGTKWMNIMEIKMWGKEVK